MKDSCKLCAGILTEAMKGINSKLAIAFVCALGIIAIIENGTFNQLSQRHGQNVAARIAQEQEQANLQAQQEQREAAARTAAHDAATAHTRYLAQYTDTSFTRKPGTKTIAIVAASENAIWNNAVNAALVSRFKREPVQLAPSFFKPAFVSDGLFNDVFAGSSGLFKRLELPKSLDGLLLAREKVQYSSDPSLENVITASMGLDVETLQIGSQAQSQTWTFNAAGAGFKQADARKLAEERLIKQILTDTNMTLTEFPNQNQ
jgi:phosphopantetheinyl transferase (holo-ACP synthase)